MKGVCVLVLLSLVGCFVEGGSLGKLEDGDELARIQKMVDYANQRVKDEDLEEVDFSDFDLNLYVFSASLLDNRISGLATLKLYGDEQHLNVTEDDQSTLTTFDVTLGFETFKMHTKAHYYTLMGSGSVSSDLKISGKAVRFVGTTVVSKTDNKAPVKLRLDSIEVVQPGKYELSFKANNENLQAIADMFAFLGEFGMNYIYPWFSNNARDIAGLSYLANKAVNTKLFLEVITH